MKPTPDPDSGQLAKTLLRTSRQGALATLMTGSGDPYCSLVNVASTADGAPILLISRLAVHTRNLAADPRVSLMLDERRAGDPLEGARIMVAGLARAVDDAAVARRYLAVHPSAEAFASFADFSFYVIRPEWLHLVAGFGRIVNLKPEAFLTELAGAEGLVAAEPDIVAHLNADHAEALGLYATRLLGGGVGVWRCTGCDPDGLDLAADGRTLRLAFPRRLANPGELRNVLRDLAAQAREGGQ
ncbi:MAG: DUF2470 domain-containing protein [Xanthobacteraceae bacterium]|nr:MAG: DUF2470 domain-containing protein [Xanthobacteraceae bacterium]